MPLKTFISLSTNYLKNMCSCEAEDILTVWEIHEGVLQYRAQFMVLANKKQRYFDVSYTESTDQFTFTEVEIKDRIDISRRKICGPF